MYRRQVEQPSAPAPRKQEAAVEAQPSAKPKLIPPTKLEIAAMGFLAVGIMRIFQTLFFRANNPRK
jgi:hypothetical protein